MKNVFCGILTLLLGVLYLVEARQIPVSALSDAVGASGFPVLIASGLIILSIFLIAQSVLRLASGRGGPVAGKDPGVWSDPRTTTLKAAGLAAIGTVFLLIMPWIGYPVSLAFLLGAVALYQGKRLGLPVTAVAVGGAVAFWLLFVFILGIPLPAGIFETLLEG